MPPVEKKPPFAARSAAKVSVVALCIPKSAPACERARKIAGKSLEASEAPKLPLRDCARMECQCRYEPVSERRRRARRGDDGERREEIRFETTNPRRKASDRRKRNALWDGR